MNIIPYTSLIIPPRRHRRFFDEERMEELALSIETHGLIHLPVCRSQDGAGLALVSGERRVRAIMMLHVNERPVRYMNELVPPGHIPFARWEELDPLVAREVELEENTIRADLSWQEQVQAQAELADLRRTQNPLISNTALASEIFDTDEPNVTVLKESEVLAANLHRPAVAKAPSRKEALKVLRKELISEHEQKLAEIVSKEKHVNTVRLIDAIEGCRGLPAEHFDCILTDPPYGVGADTWGMGATTERVAQEHGYADSWAEIAGLMTGFAPESYRIAKPQAHLFMFCDVIRFKSLKDLFEHEGWKVWPRPIIWHKDVGMIPDAEHGPRRVYECILFASKGNKPIRSLFDDVLTFATHKDKEHAAQKPVELYRFLLDRSCSPGSRVIDPFCGSGTIFPAANALHLEAFGFDIDAACVAKATLRLEEGL